MALNYIVLSGEAINSPEKKYTPEGQAISSFNVAVQSQSEENTNTISSSIKVSAIKKLADKCVNEVRQGDTVLVEGKLYTKTIENRFSQKQKIPYVQATNIQVIKTHININHNIPLEINHPSDEEEIPF